jgi:hypothetical protein
LISRGASRVGGVLERSHQRELLSTLKAACQRFLFGVLLPDHSSHLTA